MIRASAAFLQAHGNTREAKKALTRISERLRVFAAVMRAAMEDPQYRKANRADQRRWKEFHSALAEAEKETDDALASRYFETPRSLEDWEHLARIVEIPIETIEAGKLTIREIHACALAWADRQKIRAELRAETTSDGPSRRRCKATHSVDFTEVNWHGKRYLFTRTQARAVEILWRAWETGNAAVSGKHIVTTLDLGASRTFTSVFRGSNGRHDAWGTLIIPVKGIKGAYCLNDPNDPILQVASEEKRKQSRSHTEKCTGKHTGRRPDKRK
jgi:hypothetical protein